MKLKHDSVLYNIEFLKFEKRELYEKIVKFIDKVKYLTEEDKEKLSYLLYIELFNEFVPIKTVKTIMEKRIDKLREETSDEFKEIEEKGDNFFRRNTSNGQIVMDENTYLRYLIGCYVKNFYRI